MSTAREETGTGAQPAQAQAQDTPGLARRVASGAAWAQAARLAEVGLAFVLTVIFVRVLGPSAYGEYTFIVSAALLWAVLLSFGQSEAFGRFVPGLLAQGAVAQVRYLVRRMITVRLLGLGMGIAALLLLGGPVGESLGLPLLGEYAAAVAILLAGQVLVELTMGVAYARLHSRVVAIARLAGQLTALGFFVAVAWLGWADPVTAALAATLSYLLSTAILCVVDMVPLVVAGPSEPMPLGPVVSFALAAWAANLFIFTLAGQIDVLLLGAFGKGAVEIAMYSVATLVFLRLSVLLSGWANTALASFAEVRARRGREWAASLFNLYLRLHVLLALLVYPPIILLSGPVAELVFGAQYASAAGLMSLFGVFWLMCSFFFAGIPYSLLLALGRQRDVMLVRASAGALNVALDLLLIPIYGALGAIIATGAANVIAFAADFVLAARETGVSYPWSPVLRLSAVAAVAAGPVWLLVTSSGLRVAGSGLVMALLAGVAYCALFAGMLFLVKPFSGSDLGLLSRLSPGVARLLARVTRGGEG